MRKDIRQLNAAINRITILTLFAALFSIINATAVKAQIPTNLHDNQSNRRGVQISPADGATGGNGQNTARKLSLTFEEARLFKLINQERAKAGLPLLKIDPVLTELARAKSRDMVGHNYFGHISERFGSIYDQLETENIVYLHAAENLAGGRELDRVHQRLLASPAHRGNILNPKFKRVGIGIVNGGPYGKMITQIFID